MRARDHARGGARVGQRAEAKRDVHAFLDRVLPMVADRQVDVQRRMPRQKRRHQRNDLAHAEAGRHGDAQRPPQLQRPARRVIGLLERRQDRLDARQVVGAGIGQREGTRRAGDERGADVLLERGDDAGDRGLRQVQLARRGGEAAGAGDAHEEAEREQFVVHVGRAGRGDLRGSTMSHEISSRRCEGLRETARPRGVVEDAPARSFSPASARVGAAP